MTDRINPKKPELTLIRGGKSTTAGFLTLPFPDKVTRIREEPAKKRMELILADPEGERLTRALKPQELFWTLMEIGMTDALELLEYASPEQWEFFLDMELWEQSAVSQAKALEWLGHLMEAGEEKLVGQLPYLDIELLLAILTREITVGGGVGDLTSDEERIADWDHTFDNLYFITFRNPKNARVIGTLLDMIHRRNNPLYRTLMEGVKNEVESEMEEEAFQLRNGRLADLGFPSREEAVFIYARIDPASFAPAKEKKHLSRSEEGGLTVPLKDDSLLARALQKLGSEELGQELAYLVNNALVAEETPVSDSATMQSILQRVAGYLTIALEFLGGDDVERACGILEREPLKRLFQLGHSIVQQARKKAGMVAGVDYATGKALNGLKAERPRFYRGLDSDRVDGYREFSGMADVRRVEEFLEKLTG
ncbi:MAG TPA: DUF6178 family protein [Geobacteraceae bacterium]|nr:DUF6178 family protein [Geobacteraceae bacterium]